MSYDDDGMIDDDRSGMGINCICFSAIYLHSDLV